MAFAAYNEGNSNEFTLFVAPLASLRPKALAAKPVPWRKVFAAADKVTSVAVHGDYAYLLTHRGSPQYDVRRISLAQPDLATAAVVIPASDSVVMEIAGARDGLYVKRMKGGLSELLRLSYDRGARALPVPLPYAGDAGGLVPDIRVPGTAFFLGNWTRFGSIFRYDPLLGKVADTGLQPQVRSTRRRTWSRPKSRWPRTTDESPAVDRPQARHQARRKQPDAARRVRRLWIGDLAALPAVAFLPWFENGGVYAVAHVRGGGDNGKAWHDAGKGVTKPNTWKDAIASAEYLIKQGYTRPERLAIWGTSAGGIFAGRSITARPDLFAAAILSVPSVDTLRTEFGQNPLNTEDYGTVKEEASFRGLVEISAYANVEVWREIPGGAGDRRRAGSARRRLDAGEVRRADAGGHRQRQAGAVPGRGRRRPRHGRDHDAGVRGTRRLQFLRLPAVAIRRAGLPAEAVGTQAATGPLTRRSQPRN